MPARFRYQIWLILATELAVGASGCATSGRPPAASGPASAVPAAVARYSAQARPPSATVLEASAPTGIAAKAASPGTRGAASQIVAPAAFTADEPVQPAPPPAVPEVLVAPAGVPDVGLGQVLPLDFSTALAMTQGQNPRIAFAQAQIAQSLAQYSAARVMWLPSIRAGMNYNKHEGRIQDVIGSNIETSRGAAYGGLGAGAVGAASPAVPGVVMQFRLSDAIFQPRIAGSALDAQEFRATAVTNDQLLETALAYLALLEASQRRSIAAETVRHSEQLTRLTGQYAQSGAGNLADADRAAAALAVVKNEFLRTEEAMAVASARLAQQLRSDPAATIVPQEPAVVPIELVPADAEPTGLVAVGLSNRPELAASRALVMEAVNRLEREKNSPWLPSVLLGLSYGSFGAGTGGDITAGGDRLDFDAVAWWEVRNLGYGERAARENAGAQIRQARLREVETLDLVAREVVEAHAQVTARRKMIAIAEQGITSAQQSFERNLARIRNVQGLPIEVLQSIQALDAARREYLRAVVEYNQAQFRLHRALGWPVDDSAALADAEPSR